MKKVLEYAAADRKRELVALVSDDELYGAMCQIMRRVYPDRPVETLVRKEPHLPPAADGSGPVAVAWRCQDDGAQFGFVVQRLAAADVHRATRDLAQQPPQRALTIVVTSGEKVLYQHMCDVFRRLYPHRQLADLVTQAPIKEGDVACVCRHDGAGFVVAGADDEFRVERKAAADLKASIMDGREKSQTANFLALGIRADRVFKIVEGDVSDVVHGPNDKAAVSAMANPIVRHGFQTVQVDSTRATAVMIANLHAHLEHVDARKLQTDETTPAAFALHGQMAGAARDLKKQTRFGAMLCLVDGVSPELAIAICAVHRSFPALLRAYARAAAAAADDIDTLLENIHVGDAPAAGRRRRVGPAVSAAVARHFQVRALLHAARDEPFEDEEADLHMLHDDTPAAAAPAPASQTRKRGRSSDGNDNNNGGGSSSRKKTPVSIVSAEPDWMEQFL